MEIIKNKPLCFVTESIEDRIDCEYYNPKYLDFYKTLESSKYPIKNLGDKNVAFITDGEHGNPDYVKEGVLYLRAINITSDGIDIKNNIKFISEERNKKLEKSELKPNDVLLVIVGATIGKVALVPENIGKCNISRDIAKISVRERINPEYVLFYLETFLGQTQIQRYKTGFAQDGLYLKNVKQLKIILPPKNIQDQIINEVEKYRKIAKDHLHEYQKVLDEIKKIIQEKLKIEIGEKKIKTFITNSDKPNDRLDNLYHSPNYKELLKKLKKAEESKYCKIIKGDGLNLPKVLIKKRKFEKLKTKKFKYIDLGNIEKNFGTVIGFEEDILLNLPTRARQIMQENDVLIPRPIGSTGGIVIVPKEFDNQLCSTGFILVRPQKNDDAILLWTIFKSDILQKQFFYLQSGSLQPEITPKNFIGKVLVPMPKNEVRNSIIKEVKEKIKQIENFMTEYNKNIQKSKEVFVSMLFS